MKQEREYYKELEARWASLYKCNKVHFIELAKKVFNDEEIQVINNSTLEYSKLIAHKTAPQNLIYYEYEKFLTAYFVYSLLIYKLIKTGETSRAMVEKYIKILEEKALDGEIEIFTSGARISNETN